MDSVFDTALAATAIPITFATKATWETIRANLPAPARQFADLRLLVAEIAADIAQILDEQRGFPGLVLAAHKEIDERIGAALALRGLSGQLDVASDGKTYSIAFARGAAIVGHAEVRGTGSGSAQGGTAVARGEAADRALHAAGGTADGYAGSD